jgi:hypothetical protein
MAVGADIPYQLRPNKFIDRQLFLDLLSRVVSSYAEGNYAYISMGGKHLVDQESIYRRVGIKNLYAFDGSPEVVARMACNRPLPETVCTEMYSGELPGKIDTILEHFPGAQNLIVWLDFTEADERLSQLQEFAATLKKARAGDVFRITMNSDDSTLNGDWQGAKAAGPGAHRAAQLRNQIGDYFPARLRTISEDRLPWSLAEAVSLSASEAEGETDLVFRPVLLTTYADRQRMFTATVLAQANGEMAPQGLSGWEFLPDGWAHIVQIIAPDLSIREKLAIDGLLAHEPAEIIRQIGFRPATDAAYALASLASYKQLHRFYPTFYAIGIQ